MDEGILIPTGMVTGNVTSVGDIILTWTQLKAFYDSFKPICQLNYVDMSTHYFVWIDFRGQKIYCPELLKADAAVFEASYKVKCNINEYMRVRLSTNKAGRRLHSRFVTFKTASTAADKLVNDNYLNVDYGDVTYTMKNASYVTVTDPSLAAQTIIDFEPPYDYEISSGYVDIPDTLPGTADAWEVYAVAVPDIPAASGGSIELVANARLKWNMGFTVDIDSIINPAEFTYSSAYHTNKIRFIIKHPIGTSAEFQLQLCLYK